VASVNLCINSYWQQEFIMVDTVIGQKLKKRRSELNLSLRTLAVQTGLSAAFLSQIELGKSNPSLNSLQRIASSLHVSINYFLGTESDMNSSKGFSLSTQTIITKGKV
jgi:transcriptional regulator with XRE-family HTH domain